MGFLDDAEVEVSDIPSDPYGFGNDYWTIFVKEVKKPEVTKKGDRFGMQIVWAVDDPQFANSPVANQLGYGNWVQLPVPKPLQNQIPWDAKSDEGRKVLFALTNIFRALGFSADEMGGVGPEEMKLRRCMAKIKVTQNENGFFQFNPYAFKPLPTGEGGNEFHSSTTHNPGPSDEDELKKGLQDLNDDDI